jgi:hypothetical protein
VFKFIRKQNAFGLKSWYGSDQKPENKGEAGVLTNDNVEGAAKKKRGRPKKESQSSCAPKQQSETKNV